MPTWNQYTPGDPEALFAGIVQRSGQHVFGSTGSSDTEFTWGFGTFSIDGIHLELTGSGFSGHYEDDEYIINYDAGTVTGLRVVTDEGYPVVEITGMGEGTRSVFDSIINGGADGLQGFIDRQASWTYNGSVSADTITASKKADIIFGHSGNDVIKTVGGNDELYGGTGNDQLYAGSGKDVVDGGWGIDTLSGSAGKDTFVFSTHYGKDTITDFVNGIDKIDISAWKAVKDFDDVKADLSRHGEDVIIKAGDDWLTIKHIVKADIDAHDFIF